METTIQISKELQKVLVNRKLSNKESYERVIWDLIEDSLEVSEETKLELNEAREEIKQGKFKTFSEIKKKIGA
tara:strand:+ start:285 stop:503 length:219 start_codon:yes stop_codon:yes gene_type:complete